MLDHLVGDGHQVQRLSAMPQLSACLLAAALALAARAPAPQRIARGRCAAVVAVFGQPRFNLLHPSEQDLRLQSGVICPQRGIWGHQLDVERF
jgi:hypothetical protein